MTFYDRDDELDALDSAFDCSAVGVVYGNFRQILLAGRYLL